jgi:hypothetical protein
MQVLEIVSRFWEKAAPVFAILFFIARVLKFLFASKSDGPRTWRTGRGQGDTTRFYTAGRSAYPKRWSVNNIPRPLR